MNTLNESSDLTEKKEEIKTPLIDYREIRTALDEQPLFNDKSWQLSPEAFPLTPEQVSQLEDIGRACYEFHKALDILYQRSATGSNLLRNRKLEAPWVAEYLDRGKPRKLIEHSRSKRLRGELPMVIRPDLLLTDSGFIMSELDSVPGGIGLTAFLNRLYESKGGEVLGGADRILEAFYRGLVAQVAGKKFPFIAIIVSDEASTYRPEMEWLAGELQKLGRRVFVFHPDDVMPLGDTLCVDVEGNPEQIDIIYRFWELFDIAHVPVATHLLDAWNESSVWISPPMKPFQEEKLALALFHHHILEEFWRENLSKKSFKVLSKTIPESWVMDPVQLPPNAVLDAPYVRGKPIYQWEQLEDASQKERNLIIKLSGFHENAWGARSVTLGSDSSRAEWSEAIRKAIEMADRTLHILQQYHKPKRISHPVYRVDQKGESRIEAMEGRLRLCPYYFVQGDEVELTGVLATFCSADKKIIHGMSDAAMMPCRVRDTYSSRSAGKRDPR